MRPTVELAGLLTLESVPTARQALLKSFAQQPDAVIVNLAGIRAANRTLLAVFPTAVRVHGLPAVPLLLYGASAELTALVGGRVLGDVPTYGTYEQALDAVTTAQARAPRRIQVHIEPDPYAPAKARRAVTAACADWDVVDLTSPATLIVSELVANAVQHAGTGITLTVALRAHYLHINVRDGSPRLPRPSPGNLYDSPDSTSGRGLQLVDVYASGWGSNATAAGKIVWATLRATPIREL